MTTYRAKITVEFEIDLLEPDKEDAQSEYDKAITHIEKSDFLAMKECTELEVLEE